MKKPIVLVVVLLFLFFSVSVAFSHSGRTDAQGGHYNRKTGEYHYHNKGISGTNLKPSQTESDRSTASSSIPSDLRSLASDENSASQPLISDSFKSSTEKKQHNHDGGWI